MRRNSTHMLLPASVFIMILVMGGVALISTGFAQNKNIKAWGTPSEGFQLSARLDQEKLKLGEPVLLKLSLKNITRKDLNVVETSADQDYEIEVVDEHGTHAPLTEKGRRLTQYPRIYTKVVSVKVAAGQEQQVYINLNEIHDLNAKGIYSITAKRKVPKLDRSGSVDVVSNTVKLIIY
jgi:hypothetical protein